MMKMILCLPNAGEPDLPCGHEPRKVIVASLSLSYRQVGDVGKDFIN